MSRQNVNRVSEIVPVVLSLLAASIVTIAVLTGWGKASADEGLAAHLFQIFIVAQVPFIVAFIVTAEWRRTLRVAGVIGLQATALALALAPVALLKL